MILSPEEKASNRAAFRAMNLGQKAEYIFAYYKLPLVLALVACVALGSVTYRLITHKDPVLYVAFANVVPAEQADEALTAGFVEHMGKNPHRSEVVCYHDLYLSGDASQQDHQYAYASRLKLMAAADAEQVDVVLMNREAYDILSASGYLLSLDDIQGLPATAQPLLVTNAIVLSDNSVEVELGEADEYVSETDEATNAIEVTGLPLFADFPEQESIYLGIINNTPRLEESVAYLAYALERQ